MRSVLGAAAEVWDVSAKGPSLHHRRCCGPLGSAAGASGETTTMREIGKSPGSQRGFATFAWSMKVMWNMKIAAFYSANQPPELNFELPA